MIRDHGLRGQIRVLAEKDQPLHADHLIRLDAEGRRDRFNGYPDDSFIAAYSRRCFDGSATVVAYVEKGVIRGTAELHAPAAGEPAEMAFAVEPSSRRKGVGSALFARVLEEARWRRFDRLRVSCGAHNAAMRALARKFGATFVFDGPDAIGTISLGAPSPSLAPEDAFVQTSWARVAIGSQTR